MDIRKSVSKRFVVTSLISRSRRFYPALRLAPAGAPKHGEALISLHDRSLLFLQSKELDSSSPYVKSMSGQPLEQTLEAKAKTPAEANHIQVVEADGLFTYIIHAGGGRISSSYALYRRRLESRPKSARPRHHRQNRRDG